jgi:predicted phage tail protein
MGRFLSPDWSAKEEPVPYAKLDNPQSLNLYGYMRNNPLGGADADGHSPGGGCTSSSSVCQKAQSIPISPRTMQVAKGLGNAALGVATVAASLGGEVGSGGISTAISVIGVGAGTSAFVKGVTQVVGAATNTDVKKATEALDATRNPAGLLTTVATGGNMQAGDKAATALDVVTAASDVKELATQGMNGELKINAATGTKLTNLALTAHDAQTAVKPTQEQKRPDQQ